MNDNTTKHTLRINNRDYVVDDDGVVKRVWSEDYNYVFERPTGFFVRWGRNLHDDPSFSPVGPELLDLEVSVNGCPNTCEWCYKNNSNTAPTNMSFETFRRIIDVFPPTLTQVAFGITGTQTNPDFLQMMRYCRSVGIVPNFTLTGLDLTDDFAQEAAKTVGALAVSVYPQNKSVGYETVRRFTSLGLDQTNVHLLVSQETLPFVYEVLDDYSQDPRLQGVHAFVFLGVKPKGRAADNFHVVSYDEFEHLVKYCVQQEVPFGFDSCSAPKFDRAVHSLNLNKTQLLWLKMCSESCESSLFSSYINVHGEYWNCSFVERSDRFQPVHVLDVQDFLRDVWYSDQVKMFREAVLATQRDDGARLCPAFPQLNENDS